MDNLTALGLVVVLLLGNAFFVAAEFALISARRSTIEPQALAGSRRAKVTLKAMENVSIMMACAQLGITLCSLGLGALGEPAIAYYMETPLTAVGLPHGLLHPVSFAIALTIMTFLHVVIGEMVPKNITLARPDRSALLLAPQLAFIVRIFKPAIVGLNAIANTSLRIVGIAPKTEVTSAFTRDEVAGFVEESRREGLLSEEKEQLLAGTIQFDTRLVEHILIPIKKLVTVKDVATGNEVEDIVTETGYSRLPTTDVDNNLSGYIHIKDILQSSDTKQPLNGAKIRRLVVVRPQETLRTALARMQKVGSHMAIVMAKNNNVLGVVALEDALEELVGEIRDESQVS
jgi:CBS domain containing-hemolysin-like protein